MGKGATLGACGGARRSPGSPPVAAGIEEYLVILYNQNNQIWLYVLRKSRFWLYFFGYIVSAAKPRKILVIFSNFDYISPTREAV